MENAENPSKSRPHFSKNNPMAQKKFNYFHANEVVSPKEFVKDVQEMYDGTNDPNCGEDFTIAKLKWDGKLAYGIRWNRTMREAADPAKVSGIKKCIGIPVSFSHPVWFILPDFFNKSIEEFINSKQNN